jgi:hypothetical protein
MKTQELIRRITTLVETTLSYERAGEQNAMYLRGIIAATASKRLTYKRLVA